MGDAVTPPLHKALEGKPSLELRQRVEELLEKLEGPVTDPDRARQFRALQLLERIGTPEARQLLEKLAQGAPADRQSQFAAAAVKRLTPKP